jgi:hypothetical protein
MTAHAMMSGVSAVEVWLAGGPADGLWGSTIRSPSLTWPDVVPSGVRPA